MVKRWVGLQRTELGNFLDGRNVGVIPNGVMYRTDKDGLLPFYLESGLMKELSIESYQRSFMNKVTKNNQIILTEDNTYKRFY